MLISVQIATIFAVAFWAAKSSPCKTFAIKFEALRFVTLAGLRERHGNLFQSIWNLLLWLAWLHWNDVFNLFLLDGVQVVCRHRHWCLSISLLRLLGFGINWLSYLSVSRRLGWICLILGKIFGIRRTFRSFGATKNGRFCRIWSRRSSFGSLGCFIVVWFVVSIACIFGTRSLISHKKSSLLRLSASRCVLLIVFQQVLGLNWVKLGADTPKKFERAIWGQLFARFANRRTCIQIYLHSLICKQIYLVKIVVALTG